MSRKPWLSLKSHESPVRFICATQVGRAARPDPKQVVTLRESYWTLRMIAGFLVAGWCVIGSTGVAPAGKPNSKPGGGGGKGIACVTFDNEFGDNLQSDDPFLPTYCDDKPNNVDVSFSRDGHLRLQTNEKFFRGGPGRSLFMDFDDAITLYEGPEGGQIQPLTGPTITFTNTDELDANLIEDVFVVGHTVKIDIARGQSDFDFFAMEVGEIRHDINLVADLWVDWLNIDTGAAISSLAIIWLAPNVDPGPGGNRHCQVCDSVRVQFFGPNEATGLLEWRVTTGLDNDDDGKLDEDPIDGIDNDGDGSVDEDGRDAALTEISQNLFVTGTEERFPRWLRFGFTVTAPAP